MFNRNMIGHYGKNEDLRQRSYVVNRIGRHVVICAFFLNFLHAEGTDTLVQAAYIKALYVDTNEGQTDSFGLSVAVDGNLMVVGAPEEGSSATEINGDVENNDARRSGAAYVFRRSEDSWIQEAYLKAHNSFGSDRFGNSVGISGTRIVVGAPLESVVVDGFRTQSTSGAAYVFVRRKSEWVQEAYLKAIDFRAGDEFGSSVAIEGDTIVVGAVGDDQDPSSFISRGSAFVFKRSTDTWNQVAKLTAAHRDLGDAFGWKVNISNGRVVVSAPLERSAATGVNGDQEDDSQFAAGAVYVFQEENEQWTQEAYLKPSASASMQFGMSIAIDQDLIVVGAPHEAGRSTGVNGNEEDLGLQNAGAAYVFRRSEGLWQQEAYLKSSNPAGTTPVDVWGDLFGGAVDVCGDRIAVSAPFEDSSSVGINGDQGDADPEQGPTWTGGYSSGACYIFDRGENGWQQTHYVKASNTGFFDALGTAIALDDEWFIAGSFYEGSSATGINGEGSDNSAFASGAVYAYRSNRAHAPWPSSSLRYLHGAPDTVTLTFDSLPGSSYRILRSSDLHFDEGMDVLAEDYPGAEFQKSSIFVDPNPPLDKAFYRVEEREYPDS